MGSKKLKVLVAYGTGRIHASGPTGFAHAVEDTWTRIVASPRTAQWRKGNVKVYYRSDSAVWDVACEVVRNGQAGYWPPEKRQKLIDGDAGVLAHYTKMVGCFNCPAACNPFLKITDGPYAGTQGSTYWVNSIMYSVRLDVDDAKESIKFQLRCNELGLDTDMAANVISRAFECFQKGLIGASDTGGLELRWGDGAAMNRMVDKLTYREDVGDLLADGFREAANRLGKGSEAFAIHVKGQDTADAFRNQKGWGLGIATSTCGPRHLRGAAGASFHSGPKDLKREMLDYENQPEAVYWQARIKEVEDLAGICNYMGSYSGPHELGVADYARLISTALGIDISEDELMRLGEAGYNLEKAFNTLRARFGGTDDLPPQRFVDTPIEAGPFAGTRCEPDRWDDMPTRLYILHGWDPETDLQTRKGLEAVGLGCVANKLGLRSS
jgi:aldehyde:ferredoxin oxidoreductase